MQVAADVRVKDTDDAYRDLAPLMRELRDAGKPLRAIADELNAQGYETRRGKPWTPMQVRRVCNATCNPERTFRRLSAVRSSARTPTVRRSTTKGFRMSGTYRPTIIRYLNAQVRQVSKGTPGARRVREKSKTFWGRVPDANGKPRGVALCDDADAAEAMLATMKERAKRIKRGDVDPFEDHRERPVAAHVEDFRSFLESKAGTAAHVALTVQRLSAVVDGCKFKKLTDLNVGRVAGWLADRRNPKTDKDGEVIASLSVASSNHYLVAVKSFGHWLVKDRRSPENPFAHLSRMNARVDVRHERRALTQEELGGRIGTAEQSNETFRGLDGSTRAMLYRLAAMTGLRASELASLTTASFDLAADPPTVTLEAGYSKHRRENVLPLHPDLAARLRQWFSERERAQDDQRVTLSLHRAACHGQVKPERLFPGTRATRAFKMLRNDLEAAGISYVTDDGIADFHSLRHTFISNLAAGGVHPKLAQQLARHSTITLTMDRYTHLGLIDMNSALESLPTIAAPESQAMRATGTTDDAADFSCTKSCTRPTEISRSQPFLTGPMASEVATDQKQQNPQVSAENEGF
ncbi:MAG: tyrosine-type recombinase/integrase [Planctomycetaceae bacterium]